MHYCLAIDIGASSGRHIIGWQENGILQTKEVYRFPNGVLEENGRVKCVIQGHYHEGAENTVNGIRYLTLPAMCEREDAVFLMEI